MRGTVLVVGLGLATAACALIAGLDDPSEATPPISVPARDARAAEIVAPDPVEPPEVDASVEPEEGGADAGCTAGVLRAENGNVITATRAKSPPTIDGDGADWRCVDRMRFENGGFSYNMSTSSTAEIAMQWNDTHLFVWARVRTIDPAGTEASLIHRNDSFSFYVTAPSPTVDYRTNDHRLVFDGAQRVAEYVGGNVLRGSIANGISAESSTAVAQGSVKTFEIEASIAATATGRTGFALNDEVRVSFQINDVNADTSISYRLWHFALDSTCQCGGSTGGPSCNLQCTGRVVLK